MRSEDMLSRFGGDEFVGLIQQVPADLSALEQLMHRLLQAAAKPIYLDGVKLQVSCSIGVTLADSQDFESVDLLLRQADHAMYQAKIEGKNRFHVFDPAREALQKDRHTHFQRMRQALAHDELRVFYLPIVSLHTGELKGAEALVRWQHPELGLLTPDQFMPMLVDHLLDVEVGWWVIEQVMRDVQAWRKHGLDLTVNINVSAQHMQQLDFNDRLIATLAAAGLAQPVKVELEILESSVFDAMPNLSEKMNQLKRHHVRLAVDDFGTGYSSFDYLKKLSLDTLKIDRSFVANMLQDAEDRAILASMIALGHAFNLVVVAEGVETLAHGQELRAMGCDYAQGYGIAKPMPADALIGWAQNWSAGWI
jgi:EAL domain-containing protein (putative c-di-GMP-specific phosphodiesterase class I)